MALNATALITAAARRVPALREGPRGTAPARRRPRHRRPRSRFRGPGTGAIGLAATMGEVAEPPARAPSPSSRCWPPSWPAPPRLIFLLLGYILHDARPRAAPFAETAAHRRLGVRRASPRPRSWSPPSDCCSPRCATAPRSIRPQRYGELNARSPRAGKPGARPCWNAASCRSCERRSRIRRRRTRRAAPTGARQPHAPPRLLPAGLQQPGRRPRRLAPELHEPGLHQPGLRGTGSQAGVAAVTAPRLAPPPRGAQADDPQSGPSPAEPMSAMRYDHPLPPTATGGETCSCVHGDPCS